MKKDAIEERLEGFLSILRRSLEVVKQQLV